MPPSLNGVSARRGEKTALKQEKQPTTIERMARRRKDVLGMVNFEGKEKAAFQTG